MNASDIPPILLEEQVIDASTYLPKQEKMVVYQSGGSKTSKDSMQSIYIWSWLTSIEAAAQEIAYNNMNASSFPIFDSPINPHTVDELEEVEDFFSPEFPERPLVLTRSFNDIFPDYIEICEPFRLYHNLSQQPDSPSELNCYDPQTGELNTVVTIENKPNADKEEGISSQKVTFSRQHLLKFLAGSQLALVCYFKSTISSKHSFPSQFDKPFITKHKTAHLIWERAINNLHTDVKYHSESLFRLKFCILPPAHKTLVSKPKTHLSFIIGSDEAGNSIEKCCQLPNKIQWPPNVFLTPVYFKREVLEKYYKPPYLAEGEVFNRKSLWIPRSLDPSNEDPDYTTVFLGDLAALPTAEQHHWRAHNVHPTGSGRSKAAIERDFLCKPSPETPEAAFQRVYKTLNSTWETVFGWAFFLPLHQQDSSILSQIHIPPKASKEEWSGQIINLALLLVESLNEKKMKEAIQKNGKVSTDNLKGLKKLALFLEQQGIVNNALISFLHQLYDLRSALVHRRGKKLNEVMNTYHGDPDYLKQQLCDATTHLDWLLQQIKPA